MKKHSSNYKNDPDDEDWQDACTPDELSCEDGDGDHWDGGNG